MRIAYFDCFSGAAGDMIAGAMLDAGLDFEFLKSQIATLGIKDLALKVSETKRAGLRALHFVPIIKEEHHHRHLSDIIKIIEDSYISEKSKQTAIAIFNRLAQAEAAVHGKEPNDIHFHEVGAIDSIVDIVSAAIGFDTLAIEKVYCSILAVGGGQIKAAHGIMPVPAPATAELLKGVPTVGGPIDKELLTPTGAAILTTVSERFRPNAPDDY
jgi:pyridinium-3,5-bisthiocarboxylic acid mononucleotide nickel chelatase